MPSFEVDVKPELLVWAREYMGLSLEQAAEAIGRTPFELQWWEEGAPGGPSLPQLRKLADVYGIPVATFYLQQPPALKPRIVTDFRRRANTELRTWSTKLRQEFQRIERQRAILIRLADTDRGASSSLPHVVLTAPVEDEATRIRAWLGIPPNAHLEWRSRSEALNAWIDAIETHNILVFQTSGISLREMRGFSLSDALFPVIVLNGTDPLNGRIFTLLHELVHILLGQGGLCDLVTQTGKSDRDHRTIERFCNAVAASILLPTQVLKGDEVLAGATHRTVWTDKVLAKLAEKYRVSREAVLRRLVTLGFASEPFYFAKHQQYLQQYEDERADRSRESNRKMPFYPIKLRQLGRRYTRDVIKAYEADQITSADVTSYLGVSSDKVDKFEALLQASR